MDYQPKTFPRNARLIWILAVACLFFTLAGFLFSACKDSLLTPVIDDIKEIEESTWTYTVSFYSGAAETQASPSSIVVTKPATTVGQLPGEPVREGYSFGGWWTEASGAGTAFVSTTKVTGNSTVYAQWTAMVYSVTFDPQGGDLPAPWAAKNVTFGDLYGELAATAKSGSYFGGWYTASDGGTLITNTSPVSIASDHSLYAHWNSVPVFQVGFDLDGGGFIDPQNVTDGGLATIPIQAARTGYSFSGWHQDDSLTLPWDFDSDTVESSLTLYGKWIPLSYDLTLDKQGGTGGSDGGLAVYDAAMPSASAPTRVGYAFAGYFTSPNGLGDQYYSSGMASLKTWDLSSAATLYAKWVANTYTVLFDPQGGATPSPSSMVVTYAQAYGTLASTQKAGYYFDGWYTSTDLVQGSLVTHTTPVTTAADHILYARWSLIPVHALSFQSNGGSAVPPQSILHDALATMPEDPGKTGYSFDGWFREEGFTNSWIFESDTVTESLTLYAKWTTNTYTVSFDRQGGTGGSDSVAAVYDTAMPSATAPTKAGYALGGYYSGPDGTGNQYYAGDMSSARPWDGIADTTLYAKWTLLTYTISYTLNGGTNHIDNPVSYSVETPTIALQDPERTGYTFSGWYDPLISRR